MSDFEDNKSLSSKSLGLKRDSATSTPSWIGQTSKLNKNPFMHFDTFVPMTTISEDVAIKGELSFPSALRIDGQFEGKLQSEGKLHIGVKGLVISDLNLKSAIIEGTLEGNITVSESLEILSTASVKGDITAPRLKVEEGAQLEGIVSIKGL
jgi:cytoskeletal protein CcmA (bactofilin family)